MRINIFKSILIVCSVIFYCQAQNHLNNGLPIIRNFTPKEYNAHLQNWQIIQDSRGVIYSANTAGVLTFDGNFWNLYPSSNLSTIRSFAIDKNGKMFIGAIGDLGFMAIDSTGKFKYISLKNKIDKARSNFNDIWKTFSTIDGTYFITYDKIFYYKNNKFEYIKCNLLPLFGFIFNDNLYVTSKDGGIYLVKNEKLYLLPGTDELNASFGKTIVLAGNSGKLIIASSNKGFYSYNNNISVKDIINNTYNKNMCSKLQKIETDLNNYINKNGIYSGCIVNENLYAWGTISGGVVITDEKLNIVNILNKNRGILSNTILNLYEDNRKNLWIAQPQGISEVMISLPFTDFNASTGLIGSVNTTIEHNNMRYVATMQGLFYLPEKQMSTNIEKLNFFPLLKNTFFCWDVIVFKNELFATGPEDIIRIRDTSAEKIGFKYNMYCFGESKKFPNHLFVGLLDGLAYIEFPENLDNKKSIKIIKQDKLQQVNDPIRRIEQDSCGDLWLTTNYNGILNVHFKSKNINECQVTRYDTTKGLQPLGNQYVYNIKNTLYAATKKGLYKGVKTNNKNNESIHFIRDNSLFKPYLTDSSAISQLYLDKNNKLWANTEIGLGYFTKSDSANKWYNAPFKVIISDYKPLLFSNGVWIGTSDGIFKYNEDIKYDFSIKYNALINKVFVNTDSLIFNGNYYNENIKDSGLYTSLSQVQTNKLIPNLSYSDNSITFCYSATFFEFSSNLEFSFFLEGYDKAWSSWTTETKKEYTNLPEGKYIFHVKARNIYGIESNTTNYSFNILPPWYRSIWAFILYFILFVLIIYVIIIFYTKRLKAANQKLENIILERTTQILQQKEEILVQASELERINLILEDINHNLEERVAEEIEKNRQTETLLIHQSKQAAMGEMIGNIAHQWKQPLNALAVVIQNFQDAQEYGELTDELIEKQVNKGMHIIQYMSQTIADFKDFFSKEKKIQNFNVKQVVTKTYTFVENSFKNFNIQFIVDVPENIVLTGYPNEFSQVVINILNNAKDAIIEKKIANPFVKIYAYKDANIINVFIKDNAGGIPDDIIDKIFEPYFTTKDADKGTGIGLYMSKIIIEKNMRGSLNVRNTEGGAEFIITMNI